MKRIHTVLIILFVAALAQSASGQHVPSSGTTFLYMQSDSGDYIGQGRTYWYTPADGNFTGQASDHDHDGLADYVTVRFTGAGHSWSLDFGTNQLHIEMMPGFYDKAMRAPFAEAGHPGLDIYGDGRECSLTGTFTVLEAVFNYSSSPPQLVSFAAQFEQHCVSGTSALIGAIYYNYAPTNALRVYPGTVNGGEAARGIVVLTDPAPPGGAVVSLTSSNPALASVPVNVTVPEGTKVKDFAITTGVVKSPSSILLASYHGVSSSAVLKVASPIPSITKLYLKGDGGDYIVGPQEYLYTPRDGTFRTSTKKGSNGLVNYLSLNFTDLQFNASWNLELTTRKLNINLVPDSYPNAQRYPFEPAGHPGLELYGNGRGCNMLTGEFKIADAVFDYSTSTAGVSSFAADFVQYCEGGSAAASGTFYYNYTPPSMCNLSISPLSQSFSADGGTGSFNVTQPTTCSWSASSDVPWVTILSGQGAGNGTVSYSLGANPGTSNRTGIVTIAGQSFVVLQGIDFPDVAKTHAFYTEIAKLSVRGVAVECANGLYCPNEPVTREQMSALTIRSLGEFRPLPGAMQRFDDVPPTVNGQPNPFYIFIDRFAAFGITSGCAVNNQGLPLYCPGDFVTREQVAAFIIRALGEYSPPAPSSQRFLDVPPSNPFYAFIDRLGALGITNGCGGGNYCPGDNVTRGQMAALLVRAFGL